MLGMPVSVDVGAVASKGGGSVFPLVGLQLREGAAIVPHHQ